MHIKKFLHKKKEKRETLLMPPVSKKTKSGFVILHKGESVGEHVSEGKEEVIYIIQGEALIQVDDQKEYVEAGGMVFVPANKKHNVINEADEELRYMYVVHMFD